MALMPTSDCVSGFHHEAQLAPLEHCGICDASCYLLHLYRSRVLQVRLRTAFVAVPVYFTNTVTGLLSPQNASSALIHSRVLAVKAT